MLAMVGLAACGGSEGASPAAPADSLPGAAAPASDAATGAATTPSGDANSTGGDASIDSAPPAPGGDTSASADPTAVQSVSDIDTNVLPDVVVDNVTTSSRVNLRNVVPSATPVLIWMWAPH